MGVLLPYTAHDLNGGEEGRRGRGRGKLTIIVRVHQHSGVKSEPGWDIALAVLTSA